MPDYGSDYANYIASLKYQNTPEYAWQQQLVSGANLAKNLSPQTLLGLTLGTLVGSRLGNLVGNWQQESDFLKRRTNQLIDKGYSDVTYDKGNRRFMGVDANGNTIYFGRNGEIIPQQTPAINPVAVHAAVANALFPRDGFDLGWKLQHQFQTPQQFLNERLGSNPSSWDWRQKLIPPNTQYFPMTQTTATPTPTIPTPQKFSPPNSLTGNWGTAPFNGG